MRVLFAVMLTASLFAYCSAAHAEVWKLHAGNENPENEGWTFDDFNGGTGTQSGGTDTEDYWRIQRDAGAAGRYLGTLGGIQIGDPAGWTMTARVKVNTASWVSDCELAVLDGNSWWGINLCADPNGYTGVYTYNSDLGFGSALSALDPSQDYHTYQIVYTPSDGAGGGDAVTYYIDGENVGEQMRADVGFGYGIYRAQFGDSNGLQASDSQWSYVSWETGQNIFSPQLEGDLNDDGFVGGDDLDIVRSFWGQTVEQGNLLEGDPSNDGFVGGDDLDIVRANWGQGTPPAPVGVPEPSTLIGLLILGVTGSLMYFSRSQKDG